MVEAPIEDHGLIGDTRTAALVTSDGTIDWMCLPRFDCEPVFGALVGGPAAGAFRIGPAASSVVTSRRYRPHTATLETTWAVDGGSLSLTEGMVADVAGRLLPSTLMVRRLEAAGSPVEAVVAFDPRFGPARQVPAASRRGDAVVCRWSSTALALITSTPSLHALPGRPTTVSVTPGHPVTIVLAVADREPLVLVTPDTAWEALEADESAWRGWCHAVHEDLPARDAVVRSLLTLRLLTYAPSGAPVAAPTTSLPELVGGARNWDYRYAWPRDASIGVGAFLGAGHVDEARQFMAWLLHASRLDRPRLPALLTLHGRKVPPERELPGWPGYSDSRPVRVGNGARDQHQLDGYGWVLDAAWLLSRSGHPLYSETWRAMRGFADEVARRWTEPDAGIWEIRADQTHHVHSKLMAWLALDRALRLAACHRTGERRRHRWQRQRDALAADVTARGFNPRLGSYTRAYGSDDLDAALLVLPILGFEPPGSPRSRGTVDAIRRHLGAGGPLLYRYPPGSDGLAGTEGAFLPCSFWLVQALAATDRADEAGDLLAELVGLGGPLGLYAEEMDPTTRAHLGNYPQALTHAAMVQASLAVREHLGTGIQPVLD
jgi:GH15 family glucan-1,4-alpha-glucosidase